ncbi:TPA: 3-hydroxyacyl-CoA dehydrogenase [Elizabethkingia anophelis]|uniref:3-hydroxyacyl-CoA dehydrogenase n=1 Tax=Elizabethkingia anophelis TaxID=1117645 RepID=UPI00040DB1A7|nr:3-hydroxyacyl-CoA dehydrogenase [Elizabethkingia anophelis]MCT3743952.1 3-hydroxyacyl-CoA dehydrogenase [Elizabethkingia anophelis]MDC8027577.1 3-hydroxyacyl-CoA dehydrogenase [Elizabethkingia anophelis]MDV3491903.1 3-hydroxybutyryl-CoA dehydrogenase [Elizabethkingia anophelis]MDV4131288.1 3-hydroxybutyryl-CoA dehydrogenase [Elizabethkingia anophelis]MDV4135772.1 3-hydroxybutyryl-CoA dehydrogenase [Elizabethkingia anophelis]
MNFKNITVAGSGVLGYQIAFQTAFHGFHVTVYDINDEVLEKAKTKFSILSEAYKTDLGATPEQLDAAFKNLKYTADLAEAAKDADLLIEAVPESPEIKIDFYEKLRSVAPEKTIFATNSSTMLPSQFAESTGRPEKFLALHFANEIWKHNTAEIMGHPGTDKNVFNDIVAFSKAIGMVALPLQKEQPGYIVNSLLVPLLSAATNLLVNEVADAETIDKTWMVATGAPTGPFGILDIVGITTAYNINKMAADATNDPLKIKTVEYLKTNFIDKNKLGVSTGEGFYTYPNPAYKKDDFLK